ncbi:adenylate/guanylate cyclase domain-containing protein [Roseibium sediminicola]|uniref:Adenylate/guanylate cyclase domain-containing protein n=1 Tax=Roseibium sediminicola TaxID=2933272 RepID=A0ABT0H1T1_9HYPH|nr:adenylate/guanylate cyclase domain-containing protein [Roseibium sp. CAU 1639]MCK7615629.1 adenylate/guanylate cyclase domain-containing protein [Roseibium sp. CAU 1639]
MAVEAPGDARPKETGSRGMLGRGNWRQRLRLWSGLILFTFCLSHFSNHALGILSFEAMDRASIWHYWVWRSPLGETVLILAALTHVFLALWRTSKRRTLKMSRWELAQLTLGLYIPWLLIPHITTTMGAAKEFGFAPVYEQMLTILWPNLALNQSILLLVVWTHAMIGLHFWLRLYPLYRRLRPLAAGFAIAVPVLALWGWIEGARRLALSRTVEIKLTADQQAWVYEVVDQFRAVVFGLIAVSLLAILIRYLLSLRARSLSITFPGGLAIKAQPGATLLEISRINDVPLASVCGGRARCSTCRVKVLEGGESLGKPGVSEAAVLKRIGAGADVRLACQIRPEQNIAVQPLVPVKASLAAGEHLKDAYHWGVEQDVVVMFVDLRNFTGITESQLAYDVVYLLNSYLDQASNAIRAEGGYVDKFIGDGIMAIFGMDSSPATGARQALAASRRIEAVMRALDAEKGPQFRDPIRLGIGLHLGPAILGRIGAAGTEDSPGGLTALGDVVNTASRLESENKAHDSFLVVSKAVIDAAAAAIDGAETAEIKVRGKEKPLQILALSSLDSLRMAGGEAP